MKSPVLLSLIAVLQLLRAQETYSDRIKGLRVYGATMDGVPAANLQSRPITIEFDMDEPAPPDVRLRVLHCDRDWNVTNNLFINDDLHNRSLSSLPYAPAPAGTQYYRFHYSAQIPGIAGLEQFPHSGNYVFEICDQEWKQVLARGRLFVVEQILAPTMTIANRLLPSQDNPYNQVNTIQVGFVIPRPEDLRGESFSPINFKAVDIYKNRQLSDVWRIDADIRTPNTFVDGLGTTKLRFIVDNVTPGNDYRRLDLRNVTQYPPGVQLRARGGADVSRFLQPPAGDNNGASTLIVGNRYADYVPFRFELAENTRKYDEVYVVGDFSGWKPLPSCLMTYDEDSRRYFWMTTLRRGVYDYQYVVGPNDWISLEGNDWRTINIFTAFVYYHDNRLGGYDRIIGFIQRQSPGGNVPTTN